MNISEQVRRRSAGLRFRQGMINLVLAAVVAWLLPAWEPNFLVLGLFPFGMLRLVQGVELRLGMALGGWTDIPFTPPVIGCWAAASVYLQRLLGRHNGAATGRLFLWIVLGVLLYAMGRWLQQRYYSRRLGAAARSEGSGGA